MRHQCLERNERGGGLIMALLVIVALAAITAGLVMSVATDRRATSYSMTRASALNLAEAGVAEAMERIRLGDVPDNRNPKMVSQIYLAPAGSIPTVGTDTLAMPTAQPSGAWLQYSSATKDTFVLTVQYMTNAARTGIYYYDKVKQPAIQGTSGYPVFLIHSIGRDGLSRRVVDASVAQFGIIPTLKGAYVSNDDVQYNGYEYAIGYDYKADTPYGTGIGGTRNATWETGASAAAVWATGKITVKGSAKAVGNPNQSEKQTGFYAGPWEVLNMNQVDFFNWVGPPTKFTSGDPMPSGVIYLNDNNDKPQKGVKTYRFSGGDGDGLLYVNGNLQIDGNFTYRGLIYVEGDVQFKGNAWVLGCCVVADHSRTNAAHNETSTFLMSNQSIQQFIQRRRAPFVVLNWRES